MHKMLRKLILKNFVRRPLWPCDLDEKWHAFQVAKTFLFTKFHQNRSRNGWDTAQSLCSCCGLLCIVPTLQGCGGWFQKNRSKRFTNSSNGLITRIGGSCKKTWVITSTIPHDSIEITRISIYASQPNTSNPIETEVCNFVCVFCSLLWSLLIGMPSSSNTVTWTSGTPQPSSKAQTFSTLSHQELQGQLSSLLLSCPY